MMILTKNKNGIYLYDRRERSVHIVPRDSMSTHVAAYVLLVAILCVALIIAGYASMPLWVVLNLVFIMCGTVFFIMRDRMLRKKAEKGKRICLDDASRITLIEMAHAALAGSVKMHFWAGRAVAAMVFQFFLIIYGYFVDKRDPLWIIAFISNAELLLFTFLVTQQPGARLVIHKRISQMISARPRDDGLGEQ